MVDSFTRGDLLKLAQKSNVPCVSIYLATKKTGQEIYQPAKTLEQLSKMAIRQLAGHWMSTADAKKFLSPVMDLAHDQEFWQQTDLGIALFLDIDDLRKWRVDRSFSSHVSVSDQFFLRRMVDTANEALEFFILALDQNQTRLFRANRAEITEITVNDMPPGIEPTLNVTSAERGSQVHTGSREFSGKQAGVFHGHGGKSEFSKQDLLNYYCHIDAAVSKHLEDAREPLMLACVENQVSIYRDANTYPTLIDQAVIGSTAKLTPAQLHTRSLPYIHEYTDRMREAAFKSFREPGKSDRLVTEVSAIIAAAYRGQIAALLTNDTAVIPGEFNPLANQIDYAASSESFNKDILESAINQTLRHRGEVFTSNESEMPVADPMIAILRY